jgi:hypothetical protein
MNAATDPVPESRRRDQLEIELPLDPFQLARLIAPERGALYQRLGLHPLQIEAPEAATRLVMARNLRGAVR